MATKNKANPEQHGGASIGDRANAAFNQFGGTASTQIDNSPLIALAGGIALGALIAAVLPQSERELDLLEPVGSKVTTAGRNSVEKFREASKAKVDELAGDKLREYFGMGGGTAGSKD